MLSSWDGRTRKSRVPHPAQINSPLDWAQDKFADFQDGPYIGHTSAAGEFIPLYGPIRNGLAYLQDGDYGSAAASGAEAGLDALSFVPGEAAVGIAAKSLARSDKLLPLARTARQGRQVLEDAKLIKDGDEVHHAWRLMGQDRSIPSLKNHPAFLMSLPKEVHKRLHGSWLVNGVRMPRYSLIKRLDVGTPPWMKAAAGRTAAQASRALPRDDPDEP
jgi:hypothetical protein